MKKLVGIEKYNELDLKTFKEELLSDIALNYAWKSSHYQTSLETTSSIQKADFEACFDLIAYTSKSDYELSSIRWRPRAKKAEMNHIDMRYLLVRSQTDSKLLGFASFMLTIDNDQDVLYLYEIHLSDALRGQGLGKHLIDVISTLGKNAGVVKIMLTVFVRNVDAVEWYSHLGFTIDESSPEPRILRNSVVKEADYQILSRHIS